MPQEQSNIVSIPIVGQAYTEYSLELDTQACRNFYLVNDQDGKTSTALLPMPGTTIFGTVGNGPVRGLYENNNNCYAVSGNGFYSVNNAGVSTNYGTLHSSTGPVWFAANEQGGTVSQILIVDGTTGYVYHTGSHAFAQIADTNFLGAGSLAFLNGFAIVNNPNLNQGQVSNAEDFTNWTTVGESNLFSLNSVSENIIAVKDHKLEVYMFTHRNAEIWVPAVSSLPIQRRDDTLVTQGLAAAASIVSLDNTIYWLSRTSYGAGAAVYAYYDITQQKVSSPAFELATQGYSRIDDAIAYGFMWKGNLFYVVTFPTANVTWVYNIATQSWTQWSSLIPTSVNPVAQGRHISNCYCYCYGLNLVGDYNSGNIYFLDDTNFTDNGNTITRQRTTRHIFKDNRNIFLTDFELIVQAGVGVLNGQGSNPQIMLRVSNDGGYSYSKEVWRSLGKSGQYLFRPVWKQLGMGRDWVFDITLTDAVNFSILGATARFEVADT